MNSQQITQLLAARHADDVFVPQCKDGASYGQGLLILDAWAMKKSWANPLTVGYEIKVSRSDFQRDDKWHGYLAYCNEFYFVCPAGMLKPEEIPEPAGLLAVSSTGTVLFKKKKATYREVNIPDSLFRYILFSRTAITRDRSFNGKREYWEKWLQDEKIDQNFGWKVRGRLAKVVKERILNVENENKHLKDKHSQYDDVRRLLKSLDINPDQYFRSWTIEDKLEKVRRAVPTGLEDAAKGLSRSVAGLLAELEKLQATEKKSRDVVLESEEA